MWMSSCIHSQPHTQTDNANDGLKFIAAINLGIAVPLQAMNILFTDAQHNCVDVTRLTMKQKPYVHGRRRVCVPADAGLASCVLFTSR